VPGLEGVKQLSLGARFGCALVRDGSVRCWGANGQGTLGQPRPPSSPAAIAVPGVTDVERIACGGGTACAIARDGTVRCWGHDIGGLLGATTLDCVPQGASTLCGDSEGHQPTPTVVATLSGALDVALAENHGCARFGDGSVRCWGLDNHGSLGIGASPVGSLKGPWPVQGLAGVCP
jgi:alpha-tubulin suppressor-like RCC1 family protein